MVNAEIGKKIQQNLNRSLLQNDTKQYQVMAHSVQVHHLDFLFGLRL